MHTRAADFDRALTRIDTSLDTVSVDDSGELTEDSIEDLYSINALAHAGVAESEIARAVTKARENGRGWAPIAVALDAPRAETQRRFD